jgi:hypothetical protein
MANCAKGSFNMYIPSQVTVDCNPKEMNTFYTLSLFFIRIFNSLSCLHCFVWKRM